MNAQGNISTKLKNGDFVEVIAGRGKGKRGKIEKILKKENRVVVEGINMVKRHQKPTQKNLQGGIEVKEASIHLSNVMIVDPKSNRPTRIGIKFIESRSGEKKKIRVSKNTGAPLDPL